MTKITETYADFPNFEAIFFEKMHTDLGEFLSDSVVTYWVLIKLDLVKLLTEQPNGKYGNPTWRELIQLPSTLEFI